MNENSPPPESPQDDPWVTLREIVGQESPADLEQFLETLPVGEIGRAVSRLNDEDQVKLLTTLSAEKAADLVDEVSDVQAVELMQLLPAPEAAAILQELESDQQADILAELSDENVEAILGEMQPDEAANARRLVAHDPDTAGGLMLTELLCFGTDLCVRDVLEDLRENNELYSDYDVQYAYVVHRDSGRRPGPGGLGFGRLAGVLRMRDLLLNSPHTPIRQLMISDPLAVPVTASLNDLAEILDRHHFLGIPVVDADHQLLGVVRRHDVEEALTERADDDNLKLLGIVGGEELRTMPLRVRSGWRLSWLVPNILLNVVAISVIAFYEATLEQVIALAVLLPLISDMGGNAGVQAIAVSIRELNLGLLKSHELMWVALKESSVGLVNGLVLGLLIGLGGWVWKQNIYLGIVVGLAMIANTLLATTIGGVLPLVLKRMNADPALASGPILTTITDMSGFFLVLSLATAFLPQLVEAS